MACGILFIAKLIHGSENPYRSEDLQSGAPLVASAGRGLLLCNESKGYPPRPPSAAAGQLLEIADAAAEFKGPRRAIQHGTASRSHSGGMRIALSAYP